MFSSRERRSRPRPVPVGATARWRPSGRVSTAKLSTSRKRSAPATAPSRRTSRRHRVALGWQRGVGVPGRRETGSGQVGTTKRNPPGPCVSAGIGESIRRPRSGRRTASAPVPRRFNLGQEGIDVLDARSHAVRRHGELRQEDLSAAELVAHGLDPAGQPVLQDIDRAVPLVDGLEGQFLGAVLVQVDDRLLDVEQERIVDLTGSVVGLIEIVVRLVVSHRERSPAILYHGRRIKVTPAGRLRVPFEVHATSRSIPLRRSRTVPICTPLASGRYPRSRTAKIFVTWYN